MFVTSFLLARKEDIFLEFQQRVELLEHKTSKKVAIRLLFVELKFVNSVLDILNNRL